MYTEKTCYDENRGFDVDADATTGSSAKTLRYGTLWYGTTTSGNDKIPEPRPEVDYLAGTRIFDTVPQQDQRLNKLLSEAAAEATARMSQGKDRDTARLNNIKRRIMSLGEAIFRRSQSQAFKALVTNIFDNPDQY